MTGSYRWTYECTPTVQDKDSQKIDGNRTMYINEDNV